MPQNRPPVGYGRTTAATDKPQPHTSEYTLSEDEAGGATDSPPALLLPGTWVKAPRAAVLGLGHGQGDNPADVDEQAGGRVTPPPASTLTSEETANPRGALTSLRNQPPPEPPGEVEEPARWIAPTHVLGINGEPLPEGLPPPPPPRPIDALTQAVEQLFDIQTEKELDPEPGHGGSEELAAWWHGVADSDLEMLLPKAVEYSAHDLRMTGHIMADLMDIKVDDAFAAELACAVYLMSKVTRILGAYKDGRLPAIDSITDARVYATMMARIRDRGGWPGWNDAKTDMG
jgi:hypothetical protein